MTWLESIHIISNNREQLTLYYTLLGCNETDETARNNEIRSRSNFWFMIIELNLITNHCNIDCHDNNGEWI